MTPTMARGAEAYYQTHVQSRSPLELVVMLYDGALRFCDQAADAMDTGDMATKAVAMSRAFAILAELQNTLNVQRRRRRRPPARRALRPHERPAGRRQHPALERTDPRRDAPADAAPRRLVAGRDAGLPENPDDVRRGRRSPTPPASTPRSPSSTRSRRSPPNSAPSGPATSCCRSARWPRAAPR